MRNPGTRPQTQELVGVQHTFPCPVSQRLQGQPSVAEMSQGRHQATHTSLQTTHICAAVVETVDAHLPTSHELPSISQPPLLVWPVDYEHQGCAFLLGQAVGGSVCPLSLSSSSTVTWDK